MRSASASEEPPYFWTTRVSMRAEFYGDRAVNRPRRPAQASARSQQQSDDRADEDHHDRVQLGSQRQSKTGCDESDLPWFWAADLEPRQQLQARRGDEAGAREA